MPSKHIQSTPHFHWIDWLNYTKETNKDVFIFMRIDGRYCSSECTLMQSLSEIPWTTICCTVIGNILSPFYFYSTFYCSETTGHRQQCKVGRTEVIWTAIEWVGLYFCGCVWAYFSVLTQWHIRMNFPSVLHIKRSGNLPKIMVMWTAQCKFAAEPHTKNIPLLWSRKQHEVKQTL